MEVRVIRLGLSELRDITPRAPEERCEALLPFLVDACEKFGIDTPLRVAAFIAQWAHETDEWRYLEEVWGPTAQQQKYERPVIDGVPVPAVSEDDVKAGARIPLWQRLGNFWQGDGYRYRGRGLPMLTGHDNYTRCANGIGVRIDEAPDLASRLDVGCEVAGWYWRDRKLNEPADRGDFATITLRVNGGHTHLERRLAYYRRACNILLPHEGG